VQCVGLPQRASHRNKHGKFKIKLQYPGQYIVTVLLTFSSGGEEEEEELLTNYLVAPVGLLSRQKAAIADIGWEQDNNWNSH
jgi:hypothetical protein